MILVYLRHFAAFSAKGAIKAIPFSQLKMMTAKKLTVRKLNMFMYSPGRMLWKQEKLQV